MTKMCTTLAYNENEELKAVDFSVVSDNHHFGWHEDGTLHVEGNIEVVDKGDVYELVPEEDIAEELEEEGDEDNVDTGFDG